MLSYLSVEEIIDSNAFDDFMANNNSSYYTFDRALILMQRCIERTQTIGKL